MPVRQQDSGLGDTGFEHIAKTPEKPPGANQDGAESGAVLPSDLLSLPPALTEIIAGWSRLPAALKEAVLAIVRTSI
jgi:hypothetical protein